MQLIGWHSDTEDSGNFSEFLTMCPNKETGYGQYNSGNYCNPKIDDLTMAAQTETDLKKRTAILQGIERSVPTRKPATGSLTAVITAIPRSMI